jgi:hypothetical protein
MDSKSALQRARNARPGVRSAETDVVGDASRVPPNDRAALVRQIDEVMQEVGHFKALALTFERWHQDMISLVAQNREMHGKGEDLASIVKQLIMLSLNAAIEAARAGESARGFTVVAAEVRSLSLRAQTLSKDLGKDLHKSDLMTAASFQDIQAGGKLMLAAISGLESMVNQLRAATG